MCWGMKQKRKRRECVERIAFEKLHQELFVCFVLLRCFVLLCSASKLPHTHTLESHPSLSLSFFALATMNDAQLNE